MRHKKDKLLSTLGFILNLIFIAIPKDLWQWMSMRKKNVQGKNIVITGGGSGIGQRLAEIFAIDLGANVAILDIDQVSLSFGTDYLLGKSWECGGSYKREIYKRNSEGMAMRCVGRSIGRRID